MTLVEKIQQQKNEVKIVLDILERYKKILKKYEGKKVLNVDGSFAKALREEYIKELEVIKEAYNNYKPNIKGSYNLPKLFLSDYGSSDKKCLKINFCIRYSSGTNEADHYHYNSGHYAFAMVEYGILINLNSQVLENNLNRIKGYNIKSIVSKCKRVDAYLAKIKEIEKNLPLYANHNLRGVI